MMLSAGAEVVHFQEQEQLEKAVSVLYQTPCPLKPVLVSSVSGKVWLTLEAPQKFHLNVGCLRHYHVRLI